MRQLHHEPLRVFRRYRRMRDRKHHAELELMLLGALLLAAVAFFLGYALRAWAVAC